VSRRAPPSDDSGPGQGRRAGPGIAIPHPESRCPLSSLRRFLPPASLGRFLHSHSGKGVAGVFLADLLIAWPDALGWMVAGYLLYGAIGHFRQAFRSLESRPEPAVIRAEAAPPSLDPLDVATQLDRARGNRRVPAVIVREGPAPATTGAG
jgi:hypothetical protein